MRAVRTGKQSQYHMGRQPDLVEEKQGLVGGTRHITAKVQILKLIFDPNLLATADLQGIKPTPRQGPGINQALGRAGRGCRSITKSLSRVAGPDAHARVARQLIGETA